MSRVSLALALVLVASQANALSCMRPDPALTFNQMDQVPEDVYVVRGTLDFDTSLLPEGVENVQRDPAPIPAHFKGYGLTLTGFDLPYDRQVTLQPLCFGPWCGTSIAGQDMIAFAKVVGDDLVIEADPCGSTIFYDPSDAVVETLKSCIRGKSCEPTRF